MLRNQLLPLLWLACFKHYPSSDLKYAYILIGILWYVLPDYNNIEWWEHRGSKGLSFSMWSLEKRE